jgi:phosphoenolpyruvate carboxykinase (ATP)
MKYAAMLADKMSQHGTKAWLVNTGWTGGSYGVGSRISLKYTRAIIDAIHSGALDNVTFAEVPLFNLQVWCEVLLMVLQCMCHCLPGV